VRSLLERHRSLLDFALSSLARRRGKNAALLLVYAAVVFTLASVVLFTEALRRETRELLREAPELVVQRLVAGRHDLLPREWLDGLAGLRGVAGVRGRLWGYHYDPLTRANYTLLAAEEVAGVGPGRVAIGPGVARLTGARAGARLSLRRPDGEYQAFTVGEVLGEDTALVSADLVLATEADLRRFFGIAPGLYTDAAVAVTNPREVATVAAKAARLLPGARPVPRAELLRTWDSVLDWRSGLSLLAFAGAVLAFALVAWDRASGLSAEERRELGILKAIGWETSDVLLLRLWEGAVVSLSGFALGFLLAYAHVFLGGAALLAPVLRGWSTMQPELRLVPHVDPYQLAALFFLTVVPYTAATLVPSWRAAAVDPDAVMRGLP
jgi:ABC-type lipoprotein release transport system permease subunit